jgi:hypothetical protein
VANAVDLGNDFRDNATGERHADTGATTYAAQRPFAASADVAIVGYVTENINGTARKLAVIA